MLREFLWNFVPVELYNKPSAHAADFRTDEWLKKSEL